MLECGNRRQGAHVLDFRVILELGRAIHRIADDRIIEPAFVPDCAVGDRPDLDADPDARRGLAGTRLRIRPGAQCVEQLFRSASAAQVDDTRVAPKVAIAPALFAELPRHVARQLLRVRPHQPTR